MTAFKNDMTMMFVMHDALRRDLETVARISEKGGDEPRRVLATALGWQLFKTALHAHHSAEDDVLWPALREAVADRPDDIALLDAMEAEHAAVDPGLAAMDAALADAEHGHERLGFIVGKLTEGLGGHLKHEEDEALALIDAFVTPEVLARFGAEHSARVGAAAPRFLPWMLDGQSPERLAQVLGTLPEPVRGLYTAQWQPAYAELDLWAPSTAA
ncbi:hemerythrin domain-containing protein [Yinghuangia seranimata]|uniref:hemerythrin domain-containing protein n=1 Tax=Yinghuangia seranimata TaxID=408067 RepID=UPI00248C4FEA|nr:hemerythrin domain-containing protein [Yinghuangia seranimata]MDI2130925.1 hemerythrin domain-containing protein [Yinghuangia seranimata]